MREIEPYRTIKTWNDLIELEKEIGEDNNAWVFRGESCHRRPETTLRRVCTEFQIGPDDAAKLEARFVHDFRRNYEIFALPKSPGSDDIIQWLAIMRHFRVPTRLLDFTYSLFIAAFFALERAKVSDKDQFACVWAVSKTWLNQQSFRLMCTIGGISLCESWGKRDGIAFEQIFRERNPPEKIVFPVNPYTFNHRLHAQQGLFLCPGDVSVPFQDNLLEMQAASSS
jgi:hypothetical protein